MKIDWIELKRSFMKIVFSLKKVSLKKKNLYSVWKDKVNLRTYKKALYKFHKQWI